MEPYSRDCPLCRIMRSLAFSGIGMGGGIGIAYLFGASKEDMILTGIFVAAVLVFGRKRQQPRE
ncbi:MAG: hypothetical protein U1D70_13305 [Methylobacter sp.]|nr:hypothetical protein [Methylobacter sp.]MDP2428162.1 hypothetical protein [Methylobacter sp.]MDP3054370.1 hypothetical protein [Methylobacter sp.]MDP3362934.1 hypothetical protein [Methylobacter sp.]MDZ4219984.1 hypothetical protein [Methylobacter sp.]